MEQSFGEIAVGSCPVRGVLVYVPDFKPIPFPALFFFWPMSGLFG
jgi:hypothetical protein